MCRFNNSFVLSYLSLRILACRDALFNLTNLASVASKLTSSSWSAPGLVQSLHGSNSLDVLQGLILLPTSYELQIQWQVHSWHEGTYPEVRHRRLTTTCKIPNNGLLSKKKKCSFSDTVFIFIIQTQSNPNSYHARFFVPKYFIIVRVNNHALRYFWKGKRWAGGEF